MAEIDRRLLLLGTLALPFALLGCEGRDQTWTNEQLDKLKSRPGIEALETSGVNTIVNAIHQFG